MVLEALWFAILPLSSSTIESVSGNASVGILLAKPLRLEVSVLRAYRGSVVRAVAPALPTSVSSPALGIRSLTHKHTTPTAAIGMLHKVCTWSPGMGTAG